MTELSRLDELI